MPIYSVYRDDSLYFRHLTDDVPKDSSFQMHIHEQCEILYFVRGSAGSLIETSSHRLLPDTLLLMRPMESHRINIFGSEPYERFTVNFSPEIVDVIDPKRRLLSPFYDRRLGEKNVYKASEFDIHPNKLFSAMQPSETPDEGIRRTEILTYFFALLGQISAAFVKKEESLPEKRTLADDIANYINEHLYEELSLQTISELFFISVSQLNRVFKSATGFSVWEYITGKRLASARNLIRAGVPATHAFTSCGFNDYSSFYRLYVKKFGVPPKADIAAKKE